MKRFKYLDVCGVGNVQAAFIAGANGNLLGSGDKPGKGCRIGDAVGMGKGGLIAGLPDVGNGYGGGKRLTAAMKVEPIMAEP